MGRLIPISTTTKDKASYFEYQIKGLEKYNRTLLFL